MLSIWEAVWMAILQGLTEFLPISSSGHLAILGNVLRINTDGGALLEVVLHVGTLISIILIYYKDVWTLIREAVMLIVDGIRYLKNREEHPFRMYPERRMTLYVILASIPTAIIGLMVQKFLEDIFLSSLIAVGAALLVTALLLYASKGIKPGTKTLEEASIRDILTIGVVQGFATIPGISRSGSTIVTEMAAGFDPKLTVRFSFLISLPAVAGAALLSFIKADKSLVAVNAVSYLIGILVAAVVGYICLRFMVRILQKGKLYYFSYYCAVIGFFAIIMGFIL
ncbi:MAG: undecaprenyl-diphosphate phosphatase [Firmicutes bacterium]|nr:undecaprenyl-diphosphate phosphatase [Bacillota bacterium]